MVIIRTILYFAVAALAFALPSGAAWAQIVRSGDVTLDLSTALQINPEPVGSAIDETDQELLINTGFETGNLNPWFTDGGWQAVTDNPHSGIYCAYTLDNYWIRQDFTPTPASEITSASLWERQPQSAISAIEFLYQDGTFSSNVIFLTPNWEQYNVTSFIQAGQIVTGIRIYGYSSGPPPWESDIDDISVQTAGGGPLMELSTTALNFDSVLVGSDADLPLTISSVGTQTLVLRSLTCGLPVFSTNFNPADSLIPAGDSLQVTVTFTPADTVSYSDTLNIVSNCAPAFVRLRGQGVAAEGIRSSSESPLPKKFLTIGAYPNPFNPVTAIRFELRAARYVSLRVYDTAGRLVTDLVNGWREAGTHEVTFDGSGLASGIYFTRLQAGDYVGMQKLVLLK